MTTPEPIIGHDAEGHPMYARTALDNQWAAVLADMPTEARHNFEEAVYVIVDDPDGFELWGPAAAVVFELAHRERERRGALA